MGEFNCSSVPREMARNMFNVEDFEKKILQMEEATVTDGLSSEEKEEVVKAMESSGYGNNWNSCGNGHVYYIDRCGRPFEQRSCPEHGCDQMIGGAHMLLNTTNRRMRMNPTKVPEEVTEQARFNVMLGRHLGFKNKRVLAVILLALQPRRVLQELNYRPLQRAGQGRASFERIFPFQELLLQRNSPSTIHNELWILDWVDHASGLWDKDAADALMVSLLGLTIKITGAKDHGVDYQVPEGGKLSRREALQYLALIQVVAGVLEQSWDPLRIEEPHLLPQMVAMIDQMIADF